MYSASPAPSQAEEEVVAEILPHGITESGITASGFRYGEAWWVELEGAARLIVYATSAPCDPDRPHHSATAGCPNSGLEDQEPRGLPDGRE